MRTRAREIAKVGIFGSKDDPQIVNEKDLREIAETFGDVQAAPVVFGHWPDAAAPRLGNVVSVAYNEETKSLTAEIAEEDALAEAVDAGYYPDVSIRSKQRAADGKMYLVHLAYLGQEAPAIKDLAKSIKEPLGIAASDAALLRVFPSPSERQLYLSETPPEKILNNFEIESIPQSGAARTASPAGSAGAAGGGEDSAKPKEEVTTVTEDEARKLREENERLKAEAEAKDLALSDAARHKKAADRDRLKAAMDGKGIPLPAQEKALLLSEALDEGKTIELSDAGAPEGKRKIPALDCLIELVSAFTRPVEPGVLNLSEGGGNAAPGQIKFSSI
jgi:hypothetical protein